MTHFSRTTGHAYDNHGRDAKHGNWLTFNYATGVKSKKQHNADHVTVDGSETFPWCGLWFKTTTCYAPCTLCEPFSMPIMPRFQLLPTTPWLRNSNLVCSGNSSMRRGEQARFAHVWSRFIVSEKPDGIVLRGYAGTGKTTAVGAVVRTLRDARKSASSWPPRVGLQGVGTPCRKMHRPSTGTFTAPSHPEEARPMDLPNRRTTRSSL